MDAVKTMSAKGVHELDEVREAENDAQLAMNAVAEVESTMNAKVAAASDAKSNAKRASDDASKTKQATAEHAAQVIASKADVTGALNEVRTSSGAVEESGATVAKDQKD